MEFPRDFSFVEGVNFSVSRNSQVVSLWRVAQNARYYASSEVVESIARYRMADDVEDVAQLLLYTLPTDTYSISEGINRVGHVININNNGMRKQVALLNHMLTRLTSCEASEVSRFARLVLMHIDYVIASVIKGSYDMAKFRAKFDLTPIHAALFNDSVSSVSLTPSCSSPTSETVLEHNLYYPSKEERKMFFKRTGRRMPRYFLTE